MKIIISILILIITVLNCYGQSEKVNIGLLTRDVDTTFTHLYIDVVPSLNKLTPYPFNLLDYYYENLNKSLQDSNFTLTEIGWQTLYNKFNFFNFNGKPSKKCIEWMRFLYESESIDYIIFLDGDKRISSNNMSYNSNSYGIATHWFKQRIFSIYSLVYPRIYSTNPVENIDLNFQSSFILSNEIELEKEDELTLDETKNITEEYYSMTLDSIKLYTDRQVKVISKTLINEVVK